MFKDVTMLRPFKFTERQVRYTMTDKQKRFCDEYIIDLNATRAYKAAYPNIKNDNVAKSAGNRLLTNVDIKAYIEAELEKLHDERTADAKEVIEYLTSVMRREKTESVVVTISQEKSKYVPDNNGTMRKHTEKAEIPQIVEIPAKLSDANKAAEMLGKYYALFTDRTQVEGDSVIQIINDIPRGNDDDEIE